MHTRFIQRLAIIIFLGGLLGLLPAASEAYGVPPWIDKIALTVHEQKALTKEGNFDPYFKQLELLSEAAEKGDPKRKIMGQFLEMLETREGGISQEAAHRIFATVVKVTPYQYLVPMKDKSKLDPEERAMINRVEKFAAAMRDEDERAARSF